MQQDVPGKRFPSAPVPTVDTPIATELNLWPRDARCPENVALAAVKALRPKELVAYQKMSAADKIAYIQKNFPLIFRWDLSAPGRRHIVELTQPASELAKYDTMGEQDQIEYCYRQFGATGVVRPLIPQIQKDVVIAFGGVNPDIKASDVSYDQFQKVIVEQQGALMGYRYSNWHRPTLARRAGSWLLSNIPGPAGAVVEATTIPSLDSIRNQFRDPDPKWVNKSARTLIEQISTFRHDTPAAHMALLAAFDKADPTGKVAILRDIVGTVLQTAPGPFPFNIVAEYQRNLFYENVAILDPENARKWDGLDAAGRGEESQHILVSLWQRTGIILDPDPSISGSEAHTMREQLDKFKVLLGGRTDEEIARSSFDEATYNTNSKDPDAMRKMVNAAVATKALRYILLMVAFPFFN
jgi:hypothetical protein